MGGVNGQAAQQKADSHLRMEARPAAPPRGVKLSAPGGTGPGHKRTDLAVGYTERYPLHLRVGQ